MLQEYILECQTAVSHPHLVQGAQTIHAQFGKRSHKFVTRDNRAVKSLHAFIAFWQWDNSATLGAIDLDQFVGNQLGMLNHTRCKVGGHLSQQLIRQFRLELYISEVNFCAIGFVCVQNDLTVVISAYFTNLCVFLIKIGQREAEFTRERVVILLQTWQRVSI